MRVAGMLAHRRFWSSADGVRGLAAPRQRFGHDQPVLGAGEIAEKGVARLGQRERAARLFAARGATRQARAGPAAHSPPRRAARRPRPAAASPRAARAAASAPSAERDQQQRGSASRSCAPPQPDARAATSNAPTAEQQQAAPATSGQPTGSAGGLIADPVAVALDQPGADRRRASRPRRSGARTRSRMSPAISASLSAIDWPWQTRQRSSSISACARASWRGSGSWRLAQ